MHIWAVVFCVGTLTPFAKINHELFKGFARHLNSGFRPPSYHTIRKIIRVMKGKRAWARARTAARATWNERREARASVRGAVMAGASEERRQRL